MKILFVGEIVAEPGRKVVKKVLPEIKKEYDVDFVVANAENLSGGKGITQENIDEMRMAGVDYFTGGDHIFWFKDTEDFIDNIPLVRPANYPEGEMGKGYDIVDTGKNGSILIMNLIGRTFSPGAGCYADDPFRTADKILEETKDKNIVTSILDFHAEASSEKYSLAHYLDGRVGCIVGTHTHVPTADNMELPKGTLFVSDVGMCGAIDSSLGVKVDITIKMFLTARNQRFDWESAGRKAFRSVLFDTEAKSVIRIDKIV
jgi:2',3'-cyclic-nucleotide 2'-phosphodiesterase